MENNPSSEKDISPDKWRRDFLKPLIRNESRDDFKERESSESNPENYVVEISPKPDPNHLQKDDFYKRILEGSTVSMIIDLRINNEGKYTIWLGTSHLVMAYIGVQLPDNPVMSHYMIAGKVKGEKGRKNMHILRERNLIGQSCDRTPEQIAKIFDAVDIVLKNTFK